MTTKLAAAAESPPIPEEGHEPRTTESTFADLGCRLPIGLLRDNELHRGFALRPFTMKEERVLAKFKKKNRRATMGAIVSNVLAYMLTNLGPYEFEGLDDKQRLLLVNQMWMSDVMYVYVQLRIEALGEEVKFEMECGACGHKWKFAADLLRTDVTVAEDVHSLVRRHTLRHGVETPAGNVKEILLQPPRWQSMAAIPADGNESDVKLHLMAGAIRQIGDGKYPPNVSILETMTKYDLEHLQKVIDDLTPGPDLNLTVPCPACNTENIRNLDWSWDFFFTASSL